MTAQSPYAPPKANVEVAGEEVDIDGLDVFASSGRSTTSS